MSKRNIWVLIVLVTTKKKLQISIFYIPQIFKYVKIFRDSKSQTWSQNRCSSHVIKEFKAMKEICNGTILLITSLDNMITKAEILTEINNQQILIRKSLTPTNRCKMVSHGQLYASLSKSHYSCMTLEFVK